MIYEGTYPSQLQGVSQQTPQERLEGQLGAQVNMLSDPVTGLRRRTGFKIHSHLNIDANSKFDLIQLSGEYYIQAVEPSGRLVVVRFSDSAVLHDSQYPYLVHSGKQVIRGTISRNQSFILNTDKVPAKVPEGSSMIPKLTPEENSRRHWLSFEGSIGSSILSHTEASVIKSTVLGFDVTITYTHQGSYTSEQRCTQYYNKLLQNPTLNGYFTITRTGTTTICMLANLDVPDLSISYSKAGAGTADALLYRSTQPIQRAKAPTDLTADYNGYYFTEGSTTYIYDAIRKLWQVEGQATTNLNPKSSGWARILSGAFSKQYTVNITQGTPATLTYSVTTHVSTAAQATPEYVATQLESLMNADSNFTTRFSVYRDGTSLAVISNSSTDQLVIEAAGGETYLQSSGGSVIRSKDSLPPTLPLNLDGYIQGVGTVNNLAYYQYNHSTRTWKECGTYEDRYSIQNTPMYWYFDYNLGGLVVDSLDIQGRSAGDDNNNPEPAFLDFGITGISAYQSRLILLSGAYVCMSKSTDPTVFMRTTVEEVLDDDPIEISATSLSNAQFEYAVPYNKDLILFSQTQQAVVPANSTVLTPKTAVIYPSTQAEVSLAVQPVVASRSLYYTYQRGLEYYQIGELIPNQYTDAQYYPQNLTDHNPLYAKGVCTGLASSTTNNMTLFSSDSPEVLVNQYIWSGDSRAIMGFHKWVLPTNVRDVKFLQEYTVLITEVPDGILVLTTNTQLNQLDDRPVPYLDLYQYVDFDSSGEAYVPYIPDGDIVAVIYDDINSRHMEIALERDGNTLRCDHVGTVAIGLRYESFFTLTPPYLKDENGKVLAGVQSTVHSFPLTFKGTGEFYYSIHDFLGEVSTINGSAATWSEVNLGYTWVNSIGTTVVPCRSRITGLTCTIGTTSTTDLNLISAGFVLRTARKHRSR